MSTRSLVLLAAVVARCRLRRLAQARRDDHAQPREAGSRRSTAPRERRRACAREPGRARPGRDRGALARRCDPRRRADRRRHLDLERRARAHPGQRLAAATRSPRRHVRGAGRRGLPVRRRRRSAPARRDHPRHAGRAGDRRAPAGAELGPGGRRVERGGVRRRRLHRHELAEHDRPLAAGAAGPCRRAPAGPAALRRRRRGRGADRDRRRLDSGGNGQRRRALVRPGDRTRDPDRAPSQPDHARRRRGARHPRVRDRRQERDGRHADRGDRGGRPDRPQGGGSRDARLGALRPRGSRPAGEDPARRRAGRLGHGRHDLRARPDPPRPGRRPPCPSPSTRTTSMQPTRPGT